MILMHSHFFLLGVSQAQCSPVPLPALGTQRIIQGNGTTVGTVISLQCPAKHRLVGSKMMCVMDNNSTYWTGETYCKRKQKQKAITERMAPSQRWAAAFMNLIVCKWNMFAWKWIASGVFAELQWLQIHKMSVSFLYSCDGIFVEYYVKDSVSRVNITWRLLRFCTTALVFDYHIYVRKWCVAWGKDSERLLEDHSQRCRLKRTFSMRRMANHAFYTQQGRNGRESFLFRISHQKWKEICTLKSENFSIKTSWCACLVILQDDARLNCLVH